MEELLLIAGLPGVGKTTIARKFAIEKNAKVLDLDDFKRIDVDPSLVKTQIDSPEVRWAYYSKASDYAFSVKGTVIMDEVFHLESLRAKVELACRERSVSVKWIEVRCPYPIVEKRLRNSVRVGHILSTDEALKMHLLFQAIFESFPEGKDNHVVIHNNDC